MGHSGPVTSSQLIISALTLFADNVTLAGPTDDTGTACDAVQPGTDHSRPPLSSAVPVSSLGAPNDSPQVERTYPLADLYATYCCFSEVNLLPKSIPSTSLSSARPSRSLDFLLKASAMVMMVGPVPPLSGTPIREEVSAPGEVT